MNNILTIHKILTGIIIALVAIMTSCGSSGDIAQKLDAAESLMESKPDSALSILNNIDGPSLKDHRIRARHALLKSMALDKNYIDSNTFNILQPAIDYYLTQNKGSADDKLRTYYYKSVIDMHSDDYDNAMQAHLNALNIEESLTDSLTLARLLVAQGSIYYRLYKTHFFLANNIQAAGIFGHKNLIQSQLRCYARALNGAVILRNKVKADSIYYICDSILKQNPQFRKSFLRHFLGYSVRFASPDTIRILIKEVQETGISDEMKMNLARAYTKIGDAETGLKYLEEAKTRPDDILDSLTFWAVKTEILEKLGENRVALDAFRNYSRLLEEYHMKLFRNELLFSEKKHEMEMENMKSLQRKNEIIIWISAAAALLICILGILYYRYRLTRSGRLIAEQKAEKLKLENLNLDLEMEKLQLEAENLNLMVGQLEEERERLNGLVEKQDKLSSDMRRIIQERLDMLNGLFASEITNEKSHAKEYRKYVDAIKKNKKEFLHEIRRDLESTHPDFFCHIKDLGMTARETDYICLYAIGLRGKEIGVYFDVAGHYNISSEIRRKLGLDANGENLGPFIRKLMQDNG